MTMITAAQQLGWNWRAWFMGIMGAAISGLASAGASVTATSIIGMSDPDHSFVTRRHELEIMALTFAISGFVSLCKWLQTHPAPDLAVSVAAASSTKQGEVAP